jgi:hypothetical protein
MDITDSGQRTADSGQRTADSGQREKWLKDAIVELNQIIHSEKLLCNDAIMRIVREYQDELKALKD